MSHTTEVMAIFVIFLPILAITWLPWQRPLDPSLAIRNVVFGLVDPQKPYPRTKNFVNNCYTSEVMPIRRFAKSLALQEWGIFGIFAINMENYQKF